MDRKSLLVLAVCFLLLMLWMPLVNRLYPPIPAPRATNTLSRLGPVAGGTNGTTPIFSMPRSAPRPWAAPEAPEQVMTVSNRDARYTFTSHGGGLKFVELPAYPEFVGCVHDTLAPTNRLAALNLNAPVPALALLDRGEWRGGATVDDQGPFRLTRTADGVRAERDLTNGLRVVKEFRLATNYLLHATIRLENHAAQPLRLPSYELVTGTATPINRRDLGRFLGVQWFDGTKPTYVDSGWFANRTLGCGPSNPRGEYQSPGLSNVVWVAAHNQFFTLIGVPRENAPTLLARRLELPPPTAADHAADPGGKLNEKPFAFETAFLYPALVLAPGQTTEHTLDLYAGPKEYNTLARLDKHLDQAMNFRSFFGWFSKALLLSMNGLHHWGLPYGLSIILITVIIKLLFWPLTQASTRSMKRMQALQPQMKALQEKYKDDPKKMNLKLMEFMKENKVSPLGGCLPMLLQIPVFLGFYYMLQSAIELRGARFLWACDLSQPDTVAVLFGFPINPLPLIMGASQFWQARLTPPSPGVDPVQQKMMQYMPLIFLFILYNFPAGLALYWTVQNLLSILQMKLTRAATATATPVPARPAGGAGPRR